MVCIQQVTRCVICEDFVSSSRGVERNSLAVLCLGTPLGRRRVEIIELQPKIYEVVIQYSEDSLQVCD